jgi:hypothetical protein
MSTTSQLESLVAAAADGTVSSTAAATVLREERDALVAALRALVADIDRSDDGRPFVETLDRARAALAAARDVAPRQYISAAEAKALSEVPHGC